MEKWIGDRRYRWIDVWVDAQMDGYTALGKSVLTNGKDIHCPFINTYYNLQGRADSSDDCTIADSISG